MNRPLLILDLDETLIHGTTRALPVAYDFACGEYLIHKRPGVDAFVAAVAEHYDLAVWTSATAGYADVVASALFADAPLVFLWSRDRCTRRHDPETREIHWVKDLRKVKRAGHDLARVLVVEDTPRNLERNYGNAVIVDEYLGDPADRELDALAAYLASVAGTPDFRRLEKRTWRRAG